MSKFLLVLSVVCAVCVGWVIAMPMDDYGVDEVATVDDIIACQIDVPHQERDRCMMKSISNMLPKLQYGLKAVHIPPVDPLVIDNVAFNLKQGPVQAKGFVHGRAIGFLNAKLTSIKTNITHEKLNVDMTTYIPKATFEGTFKGKGKFNQLAFNSRIAINATISDVKTAMKVRGGYVMRNGERYLRVVSFDVRLTHMGGFKVNLKGLFPDEQMNMIINDLINSNWQMMYKEIVAATRGIWEPVILEQANQFTNSDIPLRAFLYFGNEGAYKVPEMM